MEKCKCPGACEDHVCLRAPQGQEHSQIEPTREGGRRFQASYTIHGTFVISYFVLLQLAFLVLTLTHLYLQLFRLAEKGVHGYLQKPGAWLEVGPVSLTTRSGQSYAGPVCAPAQPAPSPLCKSLKALRRCHSLHPRLQPV